MGTIQRNKKVEESELYNENTDIKHYKKRDKNEKSKLRNTKRRAQGK